MRSGIWVTLLIVALLVGATLVPFVRAVLRVHREVRRMGATPGMVARRVPVPGSQLHRLVADGIELVDGRLRLAGKASETLRSSSYLPW